MIFNSKLLIIILLLLFNHNIYAQNDSIKFIFNNLGFFHSDYTYGGFDGGLGRLEVEILNYTYFQSENSIMVNGKVVDYHSSKPFCKISIYLADSEPYNKELDENTYLVMNKLITKKTFSVDCLGNFEIKIDLDEYDKFYLCAKSYSLLECVIVRIKKK